MEDSTSHFEMPSVTYSSVTVKGEVLNDHPVSTFISFYLLLDRLFENPLFPSNYKYRAHDDLDHLLLHELIILISLPMKDRYFIRG